MQTIRAVVPMEVEEAEYEPAHPFEDEADGNSNDDDGDMENDIQSEDESYDSWLQDNDEDDDDDDVEADSERDRAAFQYLSYLAQTSGLRAREE